MTDLKEGDIVRYKNCTAVYKVIKKSYKLWLKKVDNGNEYIIPHKSQLVLVQRPIKRMDTAGFDTLKAADTMRGYCEEDVKITDKMMRHAQNYGRGAAVLGTALHERILNEENTMSIQINGLVAKVTDNIKDAQLVTQYFGHELNEGSIKDEFFVRDNYEELLKKAKARQEKADALAEKVRA